MMITAGPMRRRAELTVMKERKMNYILTGQMLLIMCCTVYLIWWYRGFRPNTNVSRVGGVNGILLLITATLGMAGLILSLMPIEALTEPPIAPAVIAAAGITGYFTMLLVTKAVFHRVVTSELFLITGWTVLETTVLNRLRAGGIIGTTGFAGAGSAAHTGRVFSHVRRDCCGICDQHDIVCGLLQDGRDESFLRCDGAAGDGSGGYGYDGGSHGQREMRWCQGAGL